MSNAIAAVGNSHYASAGVSAAGLEAQLARYQKQLSECVNCDSARTPEGKAQIEAISNRIGDIRQRIDRIAETKPGARIDSSAAGSSTAGSSPIDSPSTESPTSAARTSDGIRNTELKSRQAPATPLAALVGGIIDTQA